VRGGAGDSRAIAVHAGLVSTSADCSADRGAATFDDEEIVDHMKPKRYPDYPQSSATILPCESLKS
jgi:hypothetical protein